MKKEMTTNGEIIMYISCSIFINSGIYNISILPTLIREGGDSKTHNIHVRNQCIILADVAGQSTGLIPGHHNFVATVGI